MSKEEIKCFCKCRYRTSTVRYGLLVLLVAGAMVLGMQPAVAQSSGNACLKQATGLNNPSCTANDVRIGRMDLVSGPAFCDPTDPTPFQVTVLATVESGPDRYAIGFWLNEAGGDAKLDTGNNCFRDFFHPVDTFPSSTCDNNSITGPYWNADNDLCGDVYSTSTNPCGNAVLAPCTEGGGTCLFSKIQFTVNVVCADSDGNGIADVGTCTSWDNQVRTSANACTDEMDTNPGTGSKCNCGPVDIIGLHTGCINDSDCPDADGNPCTVPKCTQVGNQGVCGYQPGNAGTECRASAGVCDVAEYCTGSSADCPADGFQAATTECRASAGVCDVAESCTGSSADCPADGFKAATTECRASAGDCDVAESCTGSSADCPADGFVAATTVCREAQGPCDTAESCPGDGPDCPPLEIIECLDQAQITPTGTTCFDYRDGLASTLPYAEYKVANNVVSQVNPGVFFYYDSLDVPGPGTTTVTVTQDNNGIWKDILTNSASQIILYNTDCSKYVIGTFSNGIVTFTGVAEGSYIIGIQYKANSVVNQPETDHPTVTYDFITNVGGSPSGGTASIDYQPKQF